MGLQENWPVFLRAIKQRKKISIANFSAELEISHSTLQEYLSGKGNPCIANIDHIANKLGIDPVLAVSGAPNAEQFQVAFLLLETLERFSELSEEKQHRCAVLLYELLELWNFGTEQEQGSNEQGQEPQ